MAIRYFVATILLKFIRNFLNCSSVVHTAIRQFMVANCDVSPVRVSHEICRLSSCISGQFFENNSLGDYRIDYRLQNWTDFFHRKNNMCQPLQNVQFRTASAIAEPLQCKFFIE